MTRNPHTKANDWIPHIKAWQQSGLSKILFCEQRNLNYKTFYRWYRKLTAEDKSCHNSSPVKQPPCSTFIPIAIKQPLLSRESITFICRTGLQLQVPLSAVNRELMQVLVEALEVKPC